MVRLEGCCTEERLFLFRGRLIFFFFFEGATFFSRRFINVAQVTDIGGMFAYNSEDEDRQKWMFMATI